MDTRTKVSEYLGDNLSYINKLINAPEDLNDLPVLVRLESQLANAIELSALLAADARTPKEAADKICLTLRHRWEGIYGVNGDKGSDAVPMISPDTQANRVSVLLANSAYRLDGKLTYEALLPTVHANQCYYPARGTLAALPFRKFILAANKNIIEIAACLDNAAKNITSTLHQTVEGGGYTRLTRAESDMVINHSVPARAYYAAIKKFVVDKNMTELVAKKKEFHEAIESDTYRVTASYGQTGKRRLATRVLTLANIHTWRDLLVFAKKEKLNLDRDWYELFGMIDAPQLFTLLFPTIPLTNEYLAKVKTHLEEELAKPCDDDLYEASLLHCLVEVYYHERESQPEHTTTLASIFGGVSGVPKRDEKLHAARALQYFILMNADVGELDKCIHDYFKMNHLERVGLKLDNIRRALNEGALCDLKDRVLRKLFPNEDENKNKQSLRS